MYSAATVIASLPQAGVAIRRSRCEERSDVAISSDEIASSAPQGLFQEWLRHFLAMTECINGYLLKSV
jgi:hypothetical protein